MKILLPLLFLASEAWAGPHSSFDRLLRKYVKGSSVRYQAWHSNKVDRKALDTYVAGLQKKNPKSLGKQARLAYWINLYNSTTLKLILDHYPVKSIKSCAGGTPWKKPLVTVKGKRLTLNAIENKIIRKQFADARIHFALNCAAVGCPPLLNRAFTGKKLQKQLARVTEKTMKNKRYVRVKGKQIFLSKIFKWYKVDFVKQSGSVRKFIAHYRPDLKEKVLSEDYKVKSLAYSWKLNQTR